MGNATTKTSPVDVLAHQRARVDLNCANFIQPLAIADLPSEVLDRILDYLQDDRDSLKRAALVCRALLPRARRHLHRCIHLPYRIVKPQAIVDIYRSQDLQAFVQELLIDLSFGPSTDQDDIEALATILPSFSFTKHLAFRGGVLKADNIHRIYPIFQAYFSHVELLSISVVIFRRPEDLHSLLQCFPNLSALRMETVTFRSGKAQSEVDNFSALPRTRDLLPRLQSLHISPRAGNFREAELLDWLTSVMGPSGCTSIYLALDDFASANGLLRHCGPNLLHLKIDAQRYRSAVLGLLLHYNTSLRTLDYVCNHSTQPSGLEQDLSRIMDSTITLPTPSLQELRFVCPLPVSSDPALVLVEPLISALQRPPLCHTPNLSIVFVFDLPEPTDAAPINSSLSDTAHRLAVDLQNRISAAHSSAVVRCSTCL